MRAYLDRTVEPPRLPADNKVIEQLRSAKGSRLVRIFEDASIEPNAVLAHETHIEPNHFNDNEPEWLYQLTTPLCEAYRAGDAEGAELLLERGAMATRFVTLRDGSTASFHYTYVAHKVPDDAWTYREVLRPVPSSDPRAATARVLERAFTQELEAAARGALAPADRERALVCGLFLAIERGDRAAVDRWLALGADPTLGGPGAVTAVGLALSLRDHKTAKTLLASPEALEQICAWNIRALSSPWGTLYPIRPLHLAAVHGDAAMLRFLLERGADPAQGFPKCYPLQAHVMAHDRSGPDRGCLKALAAPTVRRLRETLGEEAMMKGLADYWSEGVRAHLERAGLVPRIRSESLDEGQ